MLFGSFTDAFPEEDRTVNDLFPEYAEVATGFTHCFANLECKVDQGSSAEAITQALRGGSALVFSRMKFNDQAVHGKEMTHIKRKTAPKGRKAAHRMPPMALEAGADKHSFAFSVILTYDQATIWVSWAEHIPNAASIFRISFLKGFSLQDSEEIISFRQKMFCILDWGLLSRKREVQQVIEKIRLKLAAKSPVVQSEQEITEESGDEDELDETLPDNSPSKKRRHRHEAS